MRGRRLNWRLWQILRIWVSEEEDKLETMSLTDSSCLSAWLMSADGADATEALSRSLNWINVPIYIMQISYHGSDTSILVLAYACTAREIAAARASSWYDY